jgi:hypothetical protein
MIRKSDWEKIGPIDERLILTYNDNYVFNKIIRTLKKKVGVAGKAFVHHFENKTLSSVPTVNKKIFKDGITWQIISAENER